MHILRTICFFISHIEISILQAASTEVMSCSEVFGSTDLTQFVNQDGLS